MGNTYAERQGQDAYDWNAFLALHRPSKFACILAVRRAKSWVTCACGNQCASIPRGILGAPSDQLLAELGCCFAQDIADVKRCVDKLTPCDSELHPEAKRLRLALEVARTTLKKIEERAAEIIFQQHAPPL